MFGLPNLHAECLAWPFLNAESRATIVEINTSQLQCSPKGAISTTLGTILGEECAILKHINSRNCSFVRLNRSSLIISAKVGASNTKFCVHWMSILSLSDLISSLSYSVLELRFALCLSLNHVVLQLHLL